MGIRTDLVTEQCEMHAGTVAGAVSRTDYYGGVESEQVEIRTADAAETLGKPIGTYVTVKFGDLLTADEFDDIRDAMTDALERLIPADCRRSVLVVGVGNRDITPDAVGPSAAEQIIATRHIGTTLAEQLGLQGLRAVSTLIPGVLGKTGIEVSEIIHGAAEYIHPSAVIVIDALAARRVERLCRTVQLSDTGITPGSGVNNARSAIDSHGLGVPVIAVGVPTVVDAATLAEDLTGSAPQKDCERMFVTPTGIDQLTERAAELIASALNRFLQPEIDRNILAEIV